MRHTLPYDTWVQEPNDRFRPGTERFRVGFFSHSMTVTYDPGRLLDLTEPEEQARTAAARFAVSRPWLDPDELEIAAREAVAEAARAYRPERGLTFSGYAEQRVRYTLREESRRQVGGVRSRHRGERRPEELPSLSLDALVAADGDPPDARAGPDAHVLSRGESDRIVGAMRACLDERACRIVWMRYAEDATLDCIAAAEGMSISGVRRILGRGVERLRTVVRSRQE